MDDVLIDRSDGILRVELNRPSRKNALTSAMYLALADAFEAGLKDDSIRVALWHGAGDCFCAGNDIEDFIKHPPGAGELKAAINAENTEFSERVRSADAKEAFAAFLEKRPPNFHRATNPGAAG